VTKAEAAFWDTSEIEPTEEVRTLAESALEKHDLRAADALQLAAALVFCHERPRGRWFVCFDRRLAAAADIEGFTVLPQRR
jgi:predicted nucleic acid-binding protein